MGNPNPTASDFNATTLVEELEALDVLELLELLDATLLDEKLLETLLELLLDTGAGAS